MRGHDEQTHHMFSYLSPEQRVPADHPLRAVRALTDHALKTMSRRFVGLRSLSASPRPTTYWTPSSKSSNQPDGFARCQEVSGLYSREARSQALDSWVNSRVVLTSSRG